MAKLHIFKDWYKNGEHKIISKRITHGQAIKFFCKECMMGNKKEIKNCTAKGCQLYLFRPYQNKEKQK